MKRYKKATIITCIVMLVVMSISAFFVLKYIEEQTLRMMITFFIGAIMYNCIFVLFTNIKTNKCKNTRRKEVE